jgi:hypothetical protein
MIDVGHISTTGTLAKYGGSLVRLQQFTAWFGVNTLVFGTRPSPGVSIMWAQLQHFVQSTSKGDYL